MDIRFYDLNGDLKLACNDYIRVIWQECLVDIAEMEIVFLQNNPVLDLLVSEQNLIAEYDKKFALVTGYSVKDGKMHLKANSLNVILSNRIIPSDTYSFYGAPENAITGCIRQYAPFISLPDEFLLSEEKQIFVKKPTLFNIAEDALKNTERGFKIIFSPKECSYNFKFINPYTNYLRLSVGNRNISNLMCDRTYENVKNAGYYTAYFIDAGTIGVNEPNLYKIRNNNPENFMKQYLAISDCLAENVRVMEGQYLYCDTPDGALKVSDEKQEFRIHYMTLTDNPALVKEVDLRDFEKEEARAYLEQTSKLSETIKTVPNNIDVNLGEFVLLEKYVGARKGLIRMQVTSIKTDSMSPLKEIKLEVKEQKGD